MTVVAIEKAVLAGRWSGETTLGNMTPFAERRSRERTVPNRLIRSRTMSPVTPQPPTARKNRRTMALYSSGFCWLLR